MKKTHAHSALRAARGAVSALFGIAALLLGPTVLFASGSTESGTATKPVTLTFVLKNTTTTAPFETIFAAYKQKTGNSVEIQALPAGEQYGTLMQTRFATNDFPDAFEMDPGTKQYVKFRAADTLYDWTNDPIVDRMTQSTKEFQTLDGKIYGIAWGSTGDLGVYYNKTIFKALGVTEPKNYADFLDIAKKAKAAGYIPIYAAIQTGWPTQIFSLDGWTTFVDPAIGDAGVRKIEMNQLRLNQIPSFKDVLSRQLALYKDGYFQDNALSGTYENQQELFGQGKVAMIFQLYNILNLLQQKFGADFVNNNVGFFPIPSDTGTGIVTLYPAGQILVPKLAGHVTQATDLVRFMTETANLNTYYAANPGIPVYKDATSKLYPAQEATLQYVKNGQAKINVQNRLSSSFTDYPKILQNMYLTGDVDGALNQLDENFRKTGKARNLPGF